jgi:ABC-type transport system involved in cytochrome c biogenesis permease subunit
MMRFLTLCFLLISSYSWAETPPSWQYLPVAYEGRTLHLKTFAKLTTEKYDIETRNASKWLFDAVFSPEYSAQQKNILIKNPEVISFLRLKARPDHLYSPKELSQHFLSVKSDIESIQDGPLKKAIQSVQMSLNFHHDISESFTAFFAFANLAWVDVPTEFHPKDTNNPPRFVDLLKHRADIKQTAKQAATTYGPNFSKYPVHLQKMAYLSFIMDSLATQGKGSTSLRIIPSASGQPISPWKSILDAEGTPQRRIYFKNIEIAATAHKNGHNAALNKALKNLTILNSKGFSKPKLHVESLYHAISPLTLLLIFSAIGVALSSGAILSQKTLLNAASTITLYGITNLLGLTLLARMYILARPPVGTLFESILFVTFVCLALTLYKGWHKHITAMLTAFVCSFGLFLLASALAETNAAMPLLTAVLNTQFWLTIHVLCITTGYAACLLTSLAAHGALLTGHISLARVRMFAVWAVFFTLTGTLLGGVWADQSWGRFWGWDPKENGALLLVLWLAWCLHLPYSLKISKAMQLTLFAATSIIVAISWFGVNMLGVGLHSYGFTQGIALGLISFVVLQSLLLIYLYKRKRFHEA